MSPLAQGILVTLLVLVPVTILLVWLFATRVFIWKPLACRFEDVRYAAASGTDLVLLARAVEAAADALRDNVEGWSEAEIAGCIDGARILVVSALKWQNIAGQWVGGEQDGRIIKVGKDFAALCHEFAHLCELGIDAKVDEGHTGWMKRGVWAADNRYRTWLAHASAGISR